jgi:hypothetical protein
VKFKVDLSEGDNLRFNKTGESFSSHGNGNHGKTNSMMTSLSKSSIRNHNLFMQKKVTDELRKST